MATRLEQIMTSVAPNTSGLDLRAGAQALAGAPAVGAPKTYGLNPAEVEQQHAQFNAAREGRWAKGMDAVQLALSQDNQLFERARMAESQLLEERKFAFTQAVQGANLKMAQAADDRQRRLADLELKGLEAEAAVMDEAMNFQVPITHPDGTVDYLSGAAAAKLGVNLRDVMADQSAQSVTQQKMDAAYNQYKSMGMSDADAGIMSTLNLTTAARLVSDSFGDSLNAITDPVLGTNYQGEDPKVWESRTQAAAIDNTFASILSPEGRQVLIQNWGPASVLMGGSEESTGPTQEQLAALTTAIVQSLQ